MEEKIREIILEDFQASEIKIVDGVDLNTIINRWVSYILSLDEIVDEDISEEEVQNAQVNLARAAAVMLAVIKAVPVLVPLVVNPILEDAALRGYINMCAEDNPINATRETKTYTLDVVIERS